MPSAAIAASANANAAAANAEAARAKRIACMKYVPGYKHDAATVVEMRQYSECISILHPAPLTGGEVIWVKAAIVAGLICAGLATYKGAKDDGIVLAILGFFMGGLLGSCLVGAAWLILAALRFLIG